MSVIVPPQPQDVIMYVTVRLHQDGAVSTLGHIADKRMALHLLDQARDTIKRQVPDDNAIMIPNRDVGVMPSLPTKDMAHIPRAERGDP